MEEHDERRSAAIRRIKSRRELNRHLVIYGAVNTLLIVIWAASGAGYFWPIWSIAGWGVGLALHAWSVHGQQPISEREILEETQRHDAAGGRSSTPPRR